MFSSTWDGVVSGKVAVASSSESPSSCGGLMTGGKMIVSVDGSVVLVRSLEDSLVGDGSSPGLSYSMLSTGVAVTDTFRGAIGDELLLPDDGSDGNGIDVITDVLFLKGCEVVSATSGKRRDASVDGALLVGDEIDDEPALGLLATIKDGSDSDALIGRSLVEMDADWLIGLIERLSSSSSSTCTISVMFVGVTGEIT